MDEEMEQYLEYRQLHKHPTYQNIWNISYSNEMGRLFQGLGKVPDGTCNQCVRGTDTFKVTRYAEIPVDRLK